MSNTSTQGDGKSQNQRGQLSLSQFMKQNRKSTFNSQKAQAITKSVGKFIAADLHPFSVVENPWFKQMMHELELRYVIPSQVHFSESVIPGLYEVRSEVFRGYAGCTITSN